MERRNGNNLRSSPLPSDYLHMVEEIFTSNFDLGIKTLLKLGMGNLTFGASGAIFPDEIVLTITLIEKGQLAATSVHMSSDYDPKASAPTIQDILAACVDGAGTLFAQLLDPEDEKRLKQISSQSLSAMDEIPFEWTPLKVEKYRLFVKVDKSNPRLEMMADDWLNRNDPDFQRRQAEEEEETKKLFVTGAKAKASQGAGSGGSGNLH